LISSIDHKIERRCAIPIAELPVVWWVLGHSSFVLDWGWMSGGHSEKFVRMRFFESERNAKQ